MDFEFRSTKLRKELSEVKAMDKVFGDRARLLRKRLTVLTEASCLADVPKGPPDRCHQLSGNRQGQIAVTIKGNWRLVFEPDHDPIPKLSDGGIDERAITRIKIVEVVDYHGE